MKKLSFLGILRVMGVEFSCCNSLDSAQQVASSCESCKVLRQALSESVHTPEYLSTAPPTVMTKSTCRTPLPRFQSGRISPMFAAQWHTQPENTQNSSDSLDKQPTSPSDMSTLPSFQPVPKWYGMQRGKHCLVRLKSTSRKFAELRERVQNVGKYSLLKAEKVQNRDLYSAFLRSQEALHRQEGGKVAVSELFYGTGKVDPYLLCADQGLDSPLIQTFGRYLCCFLEEAKDCCKYMYKSKEGHLQVLLCLVLTGAGVLLEPGDDLAEPAVSASVLSVKMRKGEKWVWAVYERERSYPAYVLTLAQSL